MRAGDIYTIAGNGKDGFGGDGGPALSAAVGVPGQVGVDRAGNVVFVSSVLGSFHNRVRVVAARTGTFYGQRMRAGDVYLIVGGAG